MFCPVYDTVRQYISRKYYMLPNFNKFYILMSCVRIILLFVCCIHVLWAGGLNQNKLFALVHVQNKHTNRHLTPVTMLQI